MMKKWCLLGLCALVSCVSAQMYGPGEEPVRSPQVCVGDTYNFGGFIEGVVVENNASLNCTGYEIVAPCSSGPVGTPDCGKILGTYPVNVSHGDRCNIVTGSITVTGFPDNESAMIRSNGDWCVEGGCPNGALFKISRQKLNEIVAIAYNTELVRQNCTCYDIQNGTSLNTRTTYLESERL